MIKYLRLALGVGRCCLYKAFYLKRLRFSGVPVLNGSLSIARAGSVCIGKRFRSRSLLNINVASGALVIGDNVFFNRSVSINCRESVRIGSRVMFGENVYIYDHDHDILRREEFICSPVVIGDNVWIGASVTILKGVSVGANSVIAAGSVVSKDVPMNSIFIQKREAVLKTLR